jgi:hypothetical protein
MSRSKRQFAVALGSAMLIALLAIPTGAEAARKKSSAGRSAVTSTEVQRANANRSSFGYQAPGRFSMPAGGGINFNDGRLGANWTGGAP